MAIPITTYFLEFYETIFDFNYDLVRKSLTIFYNIDK